MGFGQELRKAREEAGLTLGEVAEVTRIRSRYLEALEAEEWGVVPKGAIGRGFVRVVAKQVGASEKELLALYREARGEQDAAPEHAIPESDWNVGLRSGSRRSSKGGGRRYAVALLLLAAAVVFWFWRPWGAPGEGDGANPVASAVAPPPLSEGAREFAGSPPYLLEVQAVEKTQIRVTADGGDAVEQILGPGERRQYQADQLLQVDLASAGGVRFFWNGQPLRVAGDVGASLTLDFPAALETLRP